MPDPSNPQQENEPLMVLELMAKTFNLEEIKELCFELHINYDALGENLGLRSRIIALIEYARRRRLLDDLHASLQRRRPEEDWPHLSADSDWGSFEGEDPVWLEIEPPEMLKITAGVFTMGDKAGQSTVQNETPVAEIHLPEFWISKTPVSIREYANFLQGFEEVADFWHEVGKQVASPPEGWSGTLDLPSGWKDNKPPASSIETEPVQGVTWFEAVAYSKWLSARTDREYSLPSEAQWEKAVKQNKNGTIQWGQVREWTRTVWGVSRSAPDDRFYYPYSKDDKDRNRLDAGHYLYRVYRGKGYADEEETSVTTRGGFLPYYRGPHNNLHGFRVVFVRKSSEK